MEGFGRWVIESSCLVTRRNCLQLRNKYVHQALQQNQMRSRIDYIHLNYNLHVSGKHPIKNGDGILEKLFFLVKRTLNFLYLFHISSPHAEEVETTQKTVFNLRTGSVCVKVWVLCEFSSTCIMPIWMRRHCTGPSKHLKIPGLLLSSI